MHFHIAEPNFLSEFMALIIFITYPNPFLLLKSMVSAASSIAFIMDCTIFYFFSSLFPFEFPKDF